MNNDSKTIIAVAICVAVAVGFATVGWGAIFGFFALAYVFDN
jgi:hypothetical protein